MRYVINGGMIMDFNKVIYIYSDEIYLVQQKLKEMKTKFIEQHLDFNYKEYDKEVDTKKLRNEVDTYPLMAEKKMIVLK